MMRRPASRVLATLAVGLLGLLLLDALFLAYVGVALHRPGLLAGAGACVVLAIVVVLAWRRYRRALVDIEAARRAMRDEVQSIRDLLEQHRQCG